MKKSLLIGLALLLAGTGVARPIVVKTGIEVLKAQRFELLEGKRVGLITNPTGVDDGLRSTVDGPERSAECRVGGPIPGRSTACAAMRMPAITLATRPIP